MRLAEIFWPRRPRRYSDVMRAHRGKIADKWTGYLPVYDILFGPFQDRPVALLEIGVKNGGSLEVHDTYFRNARTIVGVDVDRRCGNLAFSSKRIKLVVGDAGTATTCKRIVDHSDRFDIVVDDGSHKSSDIVTAFARYFPMLAPGGIYIAEDLCCSYWQAWEGGLFAPGSSISFFKLLADVANAEHWGIEKRGPDLIRHHFPDLPWDAETAELACAQVFSVAFYNSIVVVTKADPATDRTARIGTRLALGTEPGVIDSPTTGSTLPVDETANPLSDFPPAQDPLERP